MTTDDLAWVQSRLRNCTNARRQLRICAECLYVDEGTLLESLGYGGSAGVFSLDLDNPRSSTWDFSGGRCAFVKQ